MVTVFVEILKLSVLLYVGFLNIRRYVLYLYIETLKQRLDAINQLRVDRALAAMGPAFQQVYSLLPTLLHYHHPLDETQRHYLDELELNRGMLAKEPPKGELPITGLYSMGSTSSVGQSCSSDLDIWVCHQSWLDSEERQLLQRKCSLLESWAASLGVEVSFFLIDENRFRHNESGSLGGEDCGSTQHILLLDEFYRTAVRLAGKRILWNMVPCDEEEHYDDYVMSLYAQGVLTPNEWLDLGGLSSLSAEEYFGASLWQLYKSIDSPYKAVLKTLLLEAYSWEYPNNRLLAKDIKQRLHDGEIVSFGLDPYCMMLERVTLYLQAIEDETRLDLVRRCFYLKVCEKLSRERACVGWRREVVSHLVKEWGWDEKRLMMLDNRANWKIDEVRKAHNELLDAMMQSYRNLIRFARRNNLSVSASPQDIGVLTRKLYAAFEALPGKVTLVNPQISPDLSEPNLTFIHVPPGRANRTGWYVYNRAPDMESIISHQPLEYNRYLNKLVAWAWFNGLLTSRTRLFIKGNGIVDLAKLQEMVADVAHHFPLRLPSPTPKALYSPCEIRHLAIIVNLEYDPTAAFRNQVVHFDFRKLDVFSFGEEQKCLIGSIDLLYRNSWNEVRTLHFNGEQAMIEALKTILGKMHQDAAPPDSSSWCLNALSCVFPVPARIPAVLKRYAFPGRPGDSSSSVLTSRYRSWKTPSNSTARFRITNCTACRCRWKPTTSGCRRWWMVLPAKGLFSSSLKMRITITDLTSISLMRATAPRCITTAKAAKKSWYATSAASTLRRMTALPTAPALSTLTCRSFIKSSTSTAANR